MSVTAHSTHTTIHLWRRLAAVLGVLALLATAGACGGGGGDGPDAEPYITALSDVLADLDELDGADADALECAGRAVVRSLGRDAMGDADVTPDEFAEGESLADLGFDVDDDTREEIADRLGRCDLPDGADDAVLAKYDL